MNFSDYAALHMNKAYNRADVVEEPTVADTPSISREMYQADPNKWCAKIIDDEKLLFFNHHFLNITKLRDEIQSLYSKEGYEKYGFSKLSETELVRYKTLRDIIMGEFLRADETEELDPAEIAQIIFDNEAKDFNWRPEQLTM